MNLNRRCVGVGTCSGGAGSGYCSNRRDDFTSELPVRGTLFGVNGAAVISTEVVDIGAAFEAALATSERGRLRDVEATGWDAKGEGM